MSTIKITYREQDEEQVKKTFDVLMIWFNGDRSQVLQSMNNNPIAQQKGDEWENQLDEKVQMVKDWKADEDVKIGNIRRYNGINYIVIQAHTTQANWTPDTVPALFLARPALDPGELYPAWVQPTGAHDAYKTGDRVAHNSKAYESSIDANVWEPGVTGWVEV